MKVIISGGGTGGHIYPALAIGEEIKKRFETCDLLYVGTKDSLEEELALKSNINFKPIRVKGLPRKVNKKFFIALKELFLGLNDARLILKSYKPDLVIGTGGYVSGPIVLLSSLRGIPSVIHEQNAYPGIANKLLSKFVKKVLITFEESKKFFKNPNKLVLTGNPIRSALVEIERDRAISKLNLNKDKPLILSFGGSGGQRSLNREIISLIKHISLHKDYQLIHITGKNYYDTFLKSLKDEDISLDPNISIFSYYHLMPYAINAADLIITSGGAIALAEISAVGRPSILIPKAYTAENHQEYNARAFQNAGASLMILEKDLKGNILLDSINNLFENREKLRDMGRSSKRLGNISAAKKIVDEVEVYLK